MKRTWQPKKRSRIRKIGFMKLMQTPGGRNRLKRRIAKGRTRVTLVK